MARIPQHELLNDIVDILGPGIRNVLNGSPQSGRFRQNKIPVDIVNDEKTICVYVEIPGVNKDSIDIDFYNNKLTISAEKIRTYNVPEISEIKFGNYERVITLPICVTKKDTVSVTYINGILKININKLLEEENKFSVKPSN